MFTLYQRTPVAGDCTVGYGIMFDKQYSVGLFMRTLIENNKNEWGNITVVFPNNNKVTIAHYNKKEIELYHNEYLDNIIKEGYSCGGYGVMDYRLYVE